MQEDCSCCLMREGLMLQVALFTGRSSSFVFSVACSQEIEANFFEFDLLSSIGNRNLIELWADMNFVSAIATVSIDFVRRRRCIVVPL